jgi:uncharacterized protein YaaN involved in tellurite resistance
MDNKEISLETVSTNSKGALEVVSTDRFSEEQLAKMNQLINEIDITESQAVLQYGTSAQTDISDFSDTVLDQVKGKDSGYVGNILISLTDNVKSLDVDKIGNDSGFIGRIIGQAKSSARKFIARYEKMSTTIEALVTELEKAQYTLLKDIELLDQMFEKNIDYLKNLEIFVAAGERKIETLNDIELPRMMEEANASQDPSMIQKANDFKQLVNRFEKKVHDLKLSRMIAIQAAPQIRMVQNGDQVLVEKIQSSILNTIPLWKNQVVIAITILRQEKALKAQKKVSETTNELLKKNSELLKLNTIEIAEESEKGIVEIETLQKVHADLIFTLEETVRIQEEGKVKRHEAEVELNSMAAELKQKLLAMKTEA